MLAVRAVPLPSPRKNPWTSAKAAKDAFQKMGVSKLPKVKELSEEYATVLEQKKGLLNNP